MMADITAKSDSPVPNATPKSAATPVAGESQAQADARAQALEDKARQDELAAQAEAEVAAAKTRADNPPTPAPEPEIPPETHSLTSSERTFTAQPDWNPAERDAQGNVTVYADPSGLRHYTPYSVPWQQGYKQDEPGVHADNPVAEAPFIAVRGAGGESLHITKTEAVALGKLRDKDPQAYVDQLASMGIIPEGAEYTGGHGDEIQFTTREQREQEQEAGKSLLEQRMTSDLSPFDDLLRDDPYMWGILTQNGSRVTNEGYQAYKDAMAKRESDIAGIATRAEQRRKQEVADAVALALQRISEPELKADELTPMDVTKAYRDFNDAAAQLVEDNPGMSSEERASALAALPEYKRYNALATLAQKTPGFDTRVIRDIGREALTFGKVVTPTYNKQDVENQYYQQKEIALASFMGDRAKLAKLFDKGYFGKGSEGQKAYSDTLDAVQQQEDIKAAVETGDADALHTLYKNGAFGENIAAYTNLVNYVDQGGRELSPITADDIKAVDKAYGTKDQYVKAVMDTMPSLGQLSGAVAISMVPVWGTIYNWDKMGVGMRGLSITADAFSFVPIVAGISATAKAAAGVGRMARIASGMKVIPKLAFAELVSPVTSLLHPVETVKAAGSMVKGMVKVLDPRHIPGSTLSTAFSTIRLDAAILGDPEATMYVRDQLMRLQAAGEKPTLVFGDKVFTLRSGTFMSEGGVAHASPNVRFVGEPEGFTVTTKTYPEGHPQAGQRVREPEQGMFVANVALERFTTSSAFGFEGAGQADKIKALTDAVDASKTAGDVKKASKLQSLLDDYNAAIAAGSIKKLDKAEAGITKTLGELATDETISNINNSLKTANERYLIGDIAGAQEAMQEALAFERTLQSARPGFAVFSPEIAKILVPSEKLYPGMVFQPKLGEIWSITITELKKDKAAKMLQQADDAQRLGDDVTAARFTKEATDYINSGKSGFRKVKTAEMELKFPELSQMQQMKPRYTSTASDTGAKLWIYTDKPYNLARVLKAKAMAPLDTIRNIFEPAIKVRTIPMTRAQKLTKINELLEQATELEKTGEAEQAAILRAEARVLENSLKETVKTVKSAGKADELSRAIAKAKRTDDADELIQASRRAEATGDYASADRLRRAADEVAGRRYVQNIIRRAGTVSGLAEYGLSLRGVRTAEDRIDREPQRLDYDLSRREAGRRDTGEAPLRRDVPERVETRRADFGRTPEMRLLRDNVTRTPDMRVPRPPEPPRAPSDVRTPRVPETPRELRTPRTPETPRTPRTPETPRTPDISRTPRTPEPPRVPRMPREPVLDRLGGHFHIGGGASGSQERPIPLGSIAWRQGAFWKYIPPPYNQPKPITLSRGVTPTGARFTDQRTPKETVQKIGDSDVLVPEKVLSDLGVNDLKVSNYGTEINFSGGGMSTDVGKGVPGPAQGMTVEVGELKGHAYAKKVYPQHSISRTAMDKSAPRTPAIREVKGVDRTAIAEGEKDNLDYNALNDELGPTGSFGDEVPLGAYGDEKPVRKSVNRVKHSRKQPKRKGNREDDATPQMGGIRP